jgi:hypothetical protein
VNRPIGCFSASLGPVSARVRTGFALVLAVMGITAALAPAAARAQSADDKKRASALQAEGLQKLEQGEAREALARFEQAYQLVPSPKVLFNLGKAHETLGHQVETLEAFERFLDEAPYAPPESRAIAERAVRDLRPKLSYVQIDSEESGGQVTIDDRRIGVLPMPRAIVVLPGEHQVRVEKPGSRAYVERINPLAGQKLRVVVKLETATTPPTLAATAVPSVAVPATSASPLAPTSSASDDNPPPPELVSHPETSALSWRRPAVWVASAGAVLLAGSITAQLIGSGKSDDFNDIKDAPNPTGQCSKVLSEDGGGRCAGLRKSADRYFYSALVGYGLAGASLVTAGVLYFNAPDSSRREQALACVPSFAGRGLSCALRF